MNFIVGQVTPNMLDKLKFGTYIFFAGFCLLMFLWVFFLVPETRFKTLEEMDMVFGDNLGQKDQERMGEIMREFGMEEEIGSDARIGKIAVETNEMTKSGMTVSGNEKSMI